MSWTDIFPVLDDDLLAAYENSVTQAESSEFENLFGISEVYPSRNTTNAGGRKIGHIVSATLFWKHVNDGDSDLPTPTREMLVERQTHGSGEEIRPLGQLHCAAL
ncbi:MAG: hypothetical protein QM755_08695 [Luteolibacter sp.]